MMSFKSLARFKQAVATRRERVTRVCHERQLQFQALESRRVLAFATWDGGGADNKWTTAANWEGNVAPGVGDDLFFPFGASKFETNNDFPMNTEFGEIYISGSSYSLSGNSINLAGAITSSGVGNSISCGLRPTTSMTISQLAVGKLTIRGSIDLNGFSLTANSIGVIQFDGAINGSGDITTSGEIVLNAANAYSGLTTVSSGVLRVGNSFGLGTSASGTVINGEALQIENGITISGESLSGNRFGLFSQGDNIWSGPVNVGTQFWVTGKLELAGNVTCQYLYVQSRGHLILNGLASVAYSINVDQTSFLEVNGTLTLSREGDMVVRGNLSGLGTITGSPQVDGSVSPGNEGGPGVLQTDGFFLRDGVFKAELEGTTQGIQYDQLRVNGTVTLFNVPKLNLEFGATPIIAGSEFTIIDNDGNDPVTGIFNGLGERAVFAMGSRLFRISYKGGDGNDVVLTVVVGDQVPPTDIAVSSTTIAENLNPGTVVGTLSSLDPNGDIAFTYSLMGQGPRFLVEFNDFDGPHWTGLIDTNTDDLTVTNWAVNPGQFLSDSVISVWPAVQLIYHPSTGMAYSSYDVMPIDIPDNWSGDIHQEPFIFWIGGVGADSGRNYYGGWGAGYSWDQGVSDIETGTVGLLWTTNEAVGLNMYGKVAVSQPDVLTITRVEQAPPPFRIVGNQLIVNSPLDYESNGSHTIRIRSTDAGGLSFEKTFVINVTDVNEAPTNIELRTNIVPENSNASLAIATLSTIDQDGNDTFSYSLVSGAGGDDNDRFSIVAGQLFARASFDFESKNNYSIRVRSTDAGGLSVEKSLAIIVSDVNEPSSAINLSSIAIAENSGVGALVGTLSATDPDRTDSFSYALVSGPGSDNNAMFQIVGNELRSLANFDYETKNAYTVRLRLTDAAGLRSRRPSLSR